ncbi:flavodoxin [Photobacterium sp. SDRW27]|uniref:flavodoxin n=1 Tax=Photobacterium obscurum TaxID=2829490 RepID=UPI0022430C64|nr:flavodoxin [Photobacterium obscurum]MCW8329106.1 flavodoxin [Photobacterium obscurum]
MENIAVIYGSDSGSTQKVAAQIAEKFNVSSQDIADIDVDDLPQYELVIMGTPTVNHGEVQSDWDYALNEIEDLDLAETKVAIFGLGDQLEYADTFVDAMADLADVCEDAGAEIIGQWPTEGYEHSESRAEEDGQFLGLAIDVERQANLTQQRVDKWAELLKASL